MAIVSVAMLALANALPCKAAAEVVLVGATLPLSGPSANVAGEVLRGANACTDHVNATGGVRGRMLKLLVRDDHGDADVALHNAQALVDDEGAVALVGGMGLSSMTRVLEWAAKRQVAVVGPIAGSLANQAEQLSTTFFLRANVAAEAERLSEQMATLRTRRVVIVRSDEPTGINATTAFEQAFAVRGMAAVGLETVNANGSNVDEVAQRVAQLSPEAIVLATNAIGTERMLGALDVVRKMHALKTMVYALSDAVSEQRLPALGLSAQGLILSQVVPNPKDPVKRISATYLVALHRSTNPSPSYLSFEGCINVTLLAQALAKSGEPPTVPGTLKSLRTAGTIDLGGWSVNLNNRSSPGSRYADLVFVSGDGRLLH